MKVLLIGPFPSPITGMSLANKIVNKYLPIYSNIDVDVINTGYGVLKEDLGKFSLKKFFYYIKQYKSIFKIRNVDKVYITMGQTFFGVLRHYPYLIVAKLFNKEIIVHVHGNHLWQEYEDLRGIKKKFFHKIVSMADKGIVLSESLKKNLTPFLKLDKVYILENFVEDFLFENQSEKKFDKLRIIYLSNLMREKGILDLLEALKIFDGKKIQYEAKIAGGVDESLRAIIEEKLEKIDNVEYLGLVYKEKKKELLEWGNIFVFPTYYLMEGQPISIFEAMATGNIILTTSHAGIPDVFEEAKNGFYIDKKSPISIANELIRLNQNLSDYNPISKNNIEEAKSKYRVKTFIKKLEKILKD